MNHPVATVQAISEFEAWGLLIACEILALENLKPVSYAHQHSSAAFPDLWDECSNINTTDGEGG